MNGLPSRGEITHAAAVPLQQQLGVGLARVGVAAAGRRDQAECRQRAVLVAARQSDAGHRERRRGDVVRISAGADRKQLLGQGGLFATLAGHRQRELRPQFTRHLTVDGVERRLRLVPGAGLHRSQALHPDRPPIPRVDLEQLPDHLGGSPAIADAECQLDLGQHHRSATLRRPLQGGHPLARVVERQRTQPARHRVGGVGQQPRQLRPIEALARRHRWAEQRGLMGRGRAGRRTARDHLAHHPHRLDAQVFGGLKAVLANRRAGPLHQTVERVVLCEQRHLAQRWQ